MRISGCPCQRLECNWADAPQSCFVFPPWAKGESRNGILGWKGSAWRVLQALRTFEWGRHNRGFMRIYAGTSGYSYKEWKGIFYPDDLPPGEMLRFYAAKFDAVEINNTFYRMPRKEVLMKWSEEVPEHFRFVLKAPQRMTHRKVVDGLGEDVTYFLSVASVLGEKLGPVLFQFPPWQRKDLDRLRSLLEVVQARVPLALEVRHESWLDDEVFALLRERDAALCLSDTEEKAAELIPTASWGYLRLRRCDYTAEDLRRWSEHVRGSGWETAWVFFKHEDEGLGPQMAGRFREVSEEPPSR